MKPSDVSQRVREISADLRAKSIEPQTPSTIRTSLGIPASMLPEPRGQCRLLNGTLVFASDKDDIMSDSLSTSVQLHGRTVTFDAVGVTAVRPDVDGQVVAVACDGLTFFDGPDLRIELGTRADVALWRNTTGKWEGMLQGREGPLPEALSSFTKRWSRLRLPTPKE